MKCPVCSSKKNKVKDSRDRDNRVYRRRKCSDCNISFTTYEILDTVLFDSLAEFRLRGANK